MKRKSYNGISGISKELLTFCLCRIHLQYLLKLRRQKECQYKGTYVCFCSKTPLFAMRLLEMFNSFTPVAVLVMMSHFDQMLSTNLNLRRLYDEFMCHLLLMR